jgi:hypothetical protein
VKTSLPRPDCALAIPDARVNAKIANKMTLLDFRLIFISSSGTYLYVNEVR